MTDENEALFTTEDTDLGNATATAETEPLELAGDLDHAAAGDDSEAELGEGAEHPSDPATYPIEKKTPLSTFVALSAEELADKGKQLAKKLIAIESLEEERKDINHQIKDLDDEVVKLRNALISGTVEVMTEQQDLLRQPVGPEAAAEQFADMAREAEAASQLPEADVQTIQELNAMAADIQAGVPGTEPSETFQNDIENFKAKAAKKRNGKAH